MKKQMLLISSSKHQGGEYLAHVIEALSQWLGPAEPGDNIIFVPYAAQKKDWESYTEKIRQAFAPIGYETVMINESTDLTDKTLRTKAIFIGGGNTFRLKYHLEEFNLVDEIAVAVMNGLKYIGSSAGSNMAAPTFMTTNDMPILEPNCFDGLELFPWQINPHFVPGELVDKHMGETREQRIAEFLQESETPVIGLPESHWIICDNDLITLHCVTGSDKVAMIFEQGKEPYPWEVGTDCPLQ